MEHADIPTEIAEAASAAADIARLRMQVKEHEDVIAAARREGVIDGLGRALEMTCFHHGYVSKSDIRAELERLRAL